MSINDTLRYLQQLPRGTEVSVTLTEELSHGYRQNHYSFLPEPCLTDTRFGFKVQETGSQ